MTRSIDWDKPLSDEDRQWALDRGMDLQVRANDDAHDRTTEDASGINSVVVNGIRGTEPSAASDRTQVSGIGEAQLAVNRDREEAARALLARNEGTDGGDSEGDGEDDDYSTMTKDELQEEAEKRGLSKSGNKAELQARLREDDESEDEPDDDEDEDE